MHTKPILGWEHPENFIPSLQLTLKKLMIIGT